MANGETEAELKANREEARRLNKFMYSQTSLSPGGRRQKAKSVGEALTGPVDPDGFPINLNRPVLQNPNKTISTEETITIQVGDRFYNVPTILNGKRVTKEVAVQHAIRGIKGVKNPPYPNYKTLKEAEAGAVSRSQEIGLLRGDE